MEIITLQLFNYKELTQEAKEYAIKQVRYSDRIYTDFIWNDAHNTVEAFEKHFPIKLDNRSWLDFSTTCDDVIEDLKGLRLRSYLINNYEYILYKRKFIKSLGDNKVLRHKMVVTKFFDTNKGARVSSSNFCYSNVQKDNCCTLTGVCYDLDLLNPIYKFIDNYSDDIANNEHVTFESLLKDCFFSLERSIQNEVDWHYSDEGIEDYILNNGLKFLEDGQIFEY